MTTAIFDQEIDEEEDLGYNRFDQDIDDEVGDCDLFDTGFDDISDDGGEPPDDSWDGWEREPDYRLPPNWNVTWENDTYFPRLPEVA